MLKVVSKYTGIILVGIIISLLLDVVTYANDPNHNKIYDYVAAILITFLVWEGNVLLDKMADKIVLWEKSPSKRLLMQFPLVVVYSAGIIFLSMLSYNKYVCSLPEAMKEKFMMTSIVIGVLISIILSTSSIGAQFFSKWKKSLVEVEHYKSETLQTQLQNLKNQINPHFLFNNLSVLSSLVYKDQDKAVSFISQLSKVYRYLLDNKETELVTLENELTFIKSYTFLLKIRFDESIQFNYEIADGAKILMLPPMALQILIENAIQHNECSSEYPLTVNIKADKNTLIISNNLRLRTNEEPGSKTGLKNIKERYSYFAERNIEIVSTSDTFEVSIPLLRAQ
ncbi:MAG: histidine kinase [Bacteroidetes bacterium]|nr:histidine kinase [Bacteroidota bacterium]